MKLKYAATVLLAGSSSGTASASSQPCPCWTQTNLDDFTTLFSNKVYEPGTSSCAYGKSGLKSLCLQFGANEGFCAFSWPIDGSGKCYILTPDMDNKSLTDITYTQYESCTQQIEDKCNELGYPVASAPSANQGEMKTFEQQVSVAQGKDTNTRASGHAESKSSNTELPECITLGFSGSTKGCTTYCTDNGLEFSDYAQFGDDGTVTCVCTKDGIVTNVCIKPLAGPNTAGEPCTNFGITDAKTCTDYCNGTGASWGTTETTDGKVTSYDCTCGSIVGVTTTPFSCTNNSSSALSLLLPGVVVTVTTYLIAMVI